MASTQEDVDCRKIWESIENDTTELLKTNLSDRLKENLQTNINDRVKKMHEDLDNLGENFINQVLDSFYSQKEKENEGETKDDKKQDDKKEDDKKKRKPKVDKVVEARNKRIEEIMNLTNETEKNYQLRMEELIYSVDQMINKTFVIDSSSNIFKDLTLQEILSISKDGFRFKLPRKITSMLKGKSGFDLRWDPNNNKSYSTIDKEDETNVKIHGTTCYTYYKTLPGNIKDENFSIELEYKISTYDNYFYLGLINEKVVPSSNCMCCTISNGFYIQPSGDIVLNATRLNVSKLSAEKNKVHRVLFRFLLVEKEMYITMDDNDEQGPYKISGTSFTFVSGSCNSVNGYIKIVEASYE